MIRIPAITWARGTFLAFGFDPAHAVTTFTVNSTNDGTNIKLAGAEEAWA